VPARRDHEKRGHRHKTSTDWASQTLPVVQRWYPGRTLIVVTDRAVAVIDRLRTPQQGRSITVVA
jgi:hypothetical protein